MFPNSGMLGVLCSKSVEFRRGHFFVSGISVILWRISCLAFKGLARNQSVRETLTLG